ncbi:DUF1700 domain-containing protein [Faecalibacterium prausnitzii]|jgi:hypothetical protein|uniref:DUF1700 domain-containing protein n=1 Tax=Faecalibacterium prausnitzii TaxID=853 RepID=UPI003F1E1CF9
MTRTAFLAALEQLLAPLPEAERKDALSYYEDYLDAAGPEKEAQTIAELGTPEEVAHKILEEQAPADSSAAPASPAHKPRSTWRMVLGGGLAVLAICIFLFQYSKAAPVPPVDATPSPASSTSDASSAVVQNEGTSSAASADLSGILPLTVPADDLGNSTLQIPLEKLRTELELELDYGSVVFVTDPTLTSDVYATFQFDNFPHTPLQRTSDEYGHTTLDFEMPDNWQVSPDAPEALLTVTLPADALTRLTLDLEVGDVHLDDLQLQSLKVELDNGSLYADDLTVTRDLEADISIGGCLIRQLSGTKQANISAYRSIHLCLDGDPADYTIDARTDNVVRIGSKKYDKRYTSTGPKGDLDLSATGLIDLTPQHSPA